MDTEMQTYLDDITPEHRPLFDRMHRLILEAFPDASLALSYGMPTHRTGNRKLHVGVWQHGISIYGWDKDRAAGFTSRHPDLISGKGTIQLRPQDATHITDDELNELIRASLTA
ncbi:iron chaperone [Streptomyces sp. CBMA152]|uniref:iron chaperone n=1 Tax=Streptomyces sp. CBMA152 TaxID=1896312 RepID=UPI00166129E4|nr:DUF1801 domain-containing protein [Streptomyces sp. CBMA152]MBD0741460.1 hypothetical protein [Streptomyces sp. CBMA152]